MASPARMQSSPKPPQDPGKPEAPQVGETHPQAGAQSSPPAAQAAGELGDHEWVRRAQAGDARAFEVLVRRHQARALRVARNLVADPDEAQDLAQEAFLRVFRSLDRFDFQHEFSTWLYRIVTNLAIDHLRRRRVALSTSALAEEDGSGFDLP